MMLSNLLVYRLLILNFLGLAALSWAWNGGFVGMVFAADSSGICYAIAVLFALGMASVFHRSLKVSHALNDIKQSSGRYRSKVNGAKFSAKGDHIGDIAQWLAMLGLIGTIVGFIMALHGLDTDALDPEKLIGQLIEGMGVAFYTTLAGSGAGLWLELNNRILRTATACMIEDARGV